MKETYVTYLSLDNIQIAVSGRMISVKILYEQSYNFSTLNSIKMSITYNLHQNAREIKLNFRMYTPC